MSSLETILYHGRDSCIPKLCGAPTKRSFQATILGDMAGITDPRSLFCRRMRVLCRGLSAQFVLRRYPSLLFGAPTIKYMQFTDQPP